ncbi:MAG: HlyD family efflux transporter periplasmic adaptor subunit [Verrucomicrobiota bacterium]
MENKGKLRSFAFSWKGAVTLLVIAGLWGVFGNREKTGDEVHFVAKRGPLRITVVEGGSIEALESQEVKSEVRGYQGTKILKIVEEGYLVTAEDVKNGKVLVELDSSELTKQIMQQAIQFESTIAALAEAKQGYDIQLNQNISDVKAAEQKARFARMDFEKFLGGEATREIISQLDLPPGTPANGTNGSNGLGSTGSNGDKPVDETSSPLATGTNGPARANASAEPRTVIIDFSKYAKIEVLGDGEAKQKIRKLEDEYQVAQREHSQAQATLQGTQRLFAKEFATKTELEGDQIKVENARLKVQTAETALALFLKYEFPKLAEEAMSKFVEAARELDRTRKGAISKLAQAEAKLKSSEARYNIEKRQRDDFQDQLRKCTIKAEKEGLVVYGGGNMNMNYYGQEQIREGAMVRERQPIITIPDTTKMLLKVKIHESYIKKVEKGQKVRITVDAFQDKLLEGEVTKVGVLPDSQNRWMNPDLKVYLTTIDVTGTHDWLKPGMSAKAEILVKELKDVVYVPLQAVTPDKEKYLCRLQGGGLREIEVGDFNDEFIEVKKGLNEGEKVLLRAPPSRVEKEEQKSGDSEKEKPAAGKAPPPGAK